MVMDGWRFWDHRRPAYTTTLWACVRVGTFVAKNPVLRCTKTRFSKRHITPRETNRAVAAAPSVWRSAAAAPHGIHAFAKMLCNFPWRPPMNKFKGVAGCFFFVYAAAVIVDGEALMGSTRLKARDFHFSFASTISLRIQIEPRWVTGRNRSRQTDFNSIIKVVVAGVILLFCRILAQICLIATK